MLLDSMSPADGRSRVNQCLEQYLRCSVRDSPAKWKKWLPMAEFWYNSSYHTSLGCTPFKALCGIDPNFGTMPILEDELDSSLAELSADRADFLALLREHLCRAQERIKAQADKHHQDRAFAVDEDVLLMLQPYAQLSLVNQPCTKLALKFYEPIKVLERIGAAAYRLDLPPSSLIHPVFHVSQLKPFTANYSPVFSELPEPPDLAAVPLQPLAILEYRMVKKGNTAIPQVKVRRSGIPDEHTTWEDYYVLRSRLPAAALWEEAQSQGGGSVTSPPLTGSQVATDDQAAGPDPTRQGPQVAG